MLMESVEQKRRAPPELDPERALREAPKSLVLVIDDDESIRTALAELLELSGYHNGTDGMFTSDPGEPSEMMGTYTWNLSLGATLELS